VDRAWRPEWSVVGSHLHAVYLSSLAIRKTGVAHNRSRSMNNATPSGATAQLPSLDTTAATPLDLNDFRQIQMDVYGSFAAIGLLMSAVRGETAPLDEQSGLGIAVLLECIQGRLELAVDGLDVAGKALGLARMH